LVEQSKWSRPTYVVSSYPQGDGAGRMRRKVGEQCGKLGVRINIQDWKVDNEICSESEEWFLFSSGGHNNIIMHIKSYYTSPVKFSYVNLNLFKDSYYILQ
jgi:hypothetical protein